MKPSEITAADLGVFSRRCFDAAGYDALDAAERSQVQLALNAAKGYVSGYTGLNLETSELEDVSIAVLTVGAEMLDNRQLTSQYTGQNPMVMQILDMHSINLLPTVEGEIKCSTTTRCPPA